MRLHTLAFSLFLSSLTVGCSLGDNLNLSTLGDPCGGEDGCEAGLKCSVAGPGAEPTCTQPCEPTFTRDEPNTCYGGAGLCAFVVTDREPTNLCLALCDDEGGCVVGEPALTLWGNVCHCRP